MGIMTKLGLGRRSVGSSQSKFMKVLDEHDLGFAAAGVDTPLLADQAWYKLGDGYQVLAQQMVHFGYGSADLPDNQGYLYIYLSTDTPSEIPGKVRLVQANHAETTKYVVAEFNLASTHGSITNKAMMLALPEQTQFPMVGEDSQIYLEAARTDGIAYDAAVHDVEIVQSVVYVPVTIYM
jgi:hypothetical protein